MAEFPDKERSYVPAENLSEGDVYLSSFSRRTITSVEDCGDQVKVRFEETCGFGMFTKGVELPVLDEEGPS